MSRGRDQQCNYHQCSLAKSPAYSTRAAAKCPRVFAYQLHRFPFWIFFRGFRIQAAARAVPSRLQVARCHEAVTNSVTHHHHTFSCPLLGPLPAFLGGGPLTVCLPRHSALLWRAAPHDSTPTRGDPPRVTIPTPLHTYTHLFFSFCSRQSVGVSTAPGLLRAFTFLSLSHHTHSPAPLWPPPSPGRWSSDGLPAAPFCAPVAGSATRSHSHTGRPSKG